MITTERKYLCSKEKFLEIKELSKQIAKDLKQHRIDKNSYYQKVRDFYKSKGVNVPNINWDYDYKENHYVSQYEKDGFMDKFPINNRTSQEARYANIIYGILKGKSYKQIEQKVREGNEPTAMIFYADKFGLNDIRDILRKEVGLI